MSDIFLSRRILKKKLAYVFSSWGVMPPIRKSINEVIEKSVATDVAPVVHAYWIYQKPYDEYTWRPYICSNCKTHGGKHRTNYCQSCGAKMDLCPPKRDKNGDDIDDT